MIIDKPLAFGNQVSGAFRARVRELVTNFSWPDSHADWLMACMAFETAGTFSPSIKCSVSTATGLIQFMKATAIQLGTSTNKLAAMTDVAQLAYVEAYLRPYAARIATLEDLYLAILFPKGIGQALNWVLWLSGTQAYAVNKGLDRNRDGKVTKHEAASQVRALLEAGLQPGLVWVPETPSVRWVQEQLNLWREEGLFVDGIVGPLTRGALLRFQRAMQLPETGSPTPETIEALRHPGIIWVQEQLNARGEQLVIDGVLGPKTKAALRRFQAAVDLDMSGNISAETVAALRRATFHDKAETIS